MLIALRCFWYCLKGLLKGFWWPFRLLKSVKYSQSYGLNEVCDRIIIIIITTTITIITKHVSATATYKVTTPALQSPPLTREE